MRRGGKQNLEGLSVRRDILKGLKVGRANLKSLSNYQEITKIYELLS